MKEWQLKLGCIVLGLIFIVALGYLSYWICVIKLDMPLWAWLVWG